MAKEELAEAYGRYDTEAEPERVGALVAGRAVRTEMYRSDYYEAIPFSYIQTVGLKRWYILLLMAIMNG